MASQIELSEYSTKVPSLDSKKIGIFSNAEVDEKLAIVSLTDEDKELAESLKNFLKITPLKDGLAISSDSFIGVANFSQFSVVVKPKILMDPENLFGMLNYAFDLELFKKPPIEFSPETNENFLVDIIILSIVERCERLLKQGLLKSYISFQENISFLKGKLLLKQHISNMVRHRPQFACEFDELEYDNLENQIILFCLNRCYKMINNDELLRRIRLLILQISGNVSNKLITIEDFKKINYTGQNAHYEKIHELCILIVEATGLVDFYSQRTHLVKSFFVNMNEIFEKFVFKLIQNYFPPYYDIREQESLHAWIINGVRRKKIRTDILLHNNQTGQFTVIDTKYKFHLDDDLYQIGFYIHEYSKKGRQIQKTGYAILPKNKKEPQEPYSEIFSETQGIKIIKSYIDLDEIIPLLYERNEESETLIRTKIHKLLPELE